MNDPLAVKIVQSREHLSGNALDEHLSSSPSRTIPRRRSRADSSAPCKRSIVVETSHHLTSRRVRQRPGNAAQSSTGGRPFEPADLRSSPPTVSASTPTASARRLPRCSPNRELLHRADPETPSPIVSPPPERTSLKEKVSKTTLPRQRCAFLEPERRRF